jgi:hypothetical protein
MEGILQSNEKGILPMFSMRQRINKRHQSLPPLLSFGKDLSIGSSYSQQVDESVYQMHSIAMRVLVLHFFDLALQPKFHIQFQTLVSLLHTNNKTILKIFKSTGPR